MEKIYIAIGSNIDDPIHHVKTAIDEIKLLKDCQFIQSSQLYNSAPMGPQDQPNYINAVVKIRSNITAITLLDDLQKIENDHNRIRTQKWGPRTLDLDILLYGTQNIDTNRLKIPHPGLSVRAFVLYPLSEIEPELRFSDGTTIQSLVESLGPHDINIVNKKK